VPRPKLRDEVQHPLQIIGLVLLAAVVGVAAVVTLKSSTPVPSGAVATPSFSLSTGGDQPGVLFIGDSDAAGIGLTTGTAGAFACRAASILGWGCTLDAEAGTGYVANGLTHDATFGTYMSRLQNDVAQYLPNYIVITGGRDDPGGTATETAAKAYVVAVSQAFPDAKLIVFGPFWNGPDIPGRLRSLSAALKSAASAVNATFIDPLSAGWATPSKDLAANGVDLSGAGQALLAEHVADAIQATLPTDSASPSSESLSPLPNVSPS
jgi:lysophospholipase L1-like esterase